jgi:hypothetical protein
MKIIEAYHRDDTPVLYFESHHLIEFFGCFSGTPVGVYAIDRVVVAVEVILTSHAPSTRLSD